MQKEAPGKNIVYVDADLEDLIPDFLENRQKDITVIGQLLTRGELQEIQRLGHSMKGCGSGYGFDEVTNIGRAIEEAAKVGNMTEIQDLIQKLDDYLAKVEVVWQEE